MHVASTPATLTSRCLLFADSLEEDEEEEEKGTREITHHRRTISRTTERRHYRNRFQHELFPPNPYRRHRSSESPRLQKRPQLSASQRGLAQSGIVLKQTTEPTGRVKSVRFEPLLVCFELFFLNASRVISLFDVLNQLE